jgi:hypothetical protein
MFKKITLILILSVALAGFLILRPYIFKHQDAPTIEDRLPDADYIGKAYILDVARETSGMLYYNKIPFRDLLSYEFILSQGKLYGLNLQKPIYFFGKEKGDVGAIIQVSDSSKIGEGIKRLTKIIAVDDTLINEQKIYRYKKENVFLTYSNNYLFVFKGTNFSFFNKRVALAKRNDQSNLWKTFLGEKQFKNEKLVIYSNARQLNEYGIEKAIFAHDSDSTSFSLKAYVKNIKNFNFKQKDAGISFVNSGSTNKMLNIHLDSKKLRQHPEDPIYQLLVRLGRKISFPTKEFLEAWEGDLSFREGGKQTIQESYIETVLDEDFNTTEVEKKKAVEVSGFSLLFTTNEHGKSFINKLFAKGILTKTDNKFRFLYSPPLKMNVVKNTYYFYSGDVCPKTEIHAKNNGIFLRKGTKIEFNLDSLSKNEVFGTLYIPVDRLFKAGKRFSF